MWVPTIATVESDPVLHGRYQFWTFAYPTDDPLLISALKLRESLEQGLPSSHAPFPRISITVYNVLWLWQDEIRKAMSWAQTRFEYAGWLRRGKFQRVLPKVVGLRTEPP